MFEHSSKNEVDLINRYDHTIKELDVIIRKKEATQQQKKQKDKKEVIGSNPLVLGGVVIDEKEFEDENLCQLCCF